MAKSNDKTKPYVVGIGASAGGLDALRKLAANIPTDSGFCFIVAQHVSPSHTSILAEILSKSTLIDVVEAKAKQPLTPNIMYICPPNSHISIAKNLLVTDVANNTVGPKPSIDRLFVSMARALKDNCCGIILSGTGSDGAHGCRTLRASGALTIVQTLASAQYDAMPKAALALGGAELTLDAEEIGKSLLKLSKLPFSDRQQRSKEKIDATSEQEPLLVILKLARDLTGIDFTRYKRGTIDRQIDRRIAALQLNNIESYADLLKEDPSELRLLAQSFLISVTGFFRDPEAYDELHSQLTSALQSFNLKKSQFRIWVAGCATGEEAYSVAMVVHECLKDHYAVDNVRIFATDVDEHALQFARRGIYSHAILDDVSSDRISKFFIETEQGFEVKKNIKAMVLFSKHNLAANPPFLKLSLVSCRNVLIYFNRELQEQIIDVFHYSLLPHGILMLGNSETVIQSDNLFNKQSEQKIYKKNPSPVRRLFAFQPKTDSTIEHPIPAFQTQTTRIKKYEKIINDSILDSFGPPTALINSNDMVLELSGNTRNYFTMSPGSTDLHIYKLIPKEFQASLRTILHSAKRSGEPQSCVVSNADKKQNFKIQVSKVDATDEELFLVSIIEINTNELTGHMGNISDAMSESVNVDKDDVIAQLQEELKTTRQQLQMVIEDYETNSEELQAITEEMQASSEELQASNEELATSNEELQATNEELRTVNDELTVKSSEISKINLDLQNIQDAAGTGLVVLDSLLNIRNFNTTSIRILGLTKHDIGRAFATLPIRISASKIVDELKKIISGHTQRTLFFSSSDMYYKVELKPFYDGNERIDGVVLSFIDVTDFEQQKRQLKQTSELFNMLVDNMSLAIWVQEPSFGNIKYLSKGFKHVFGLEPQMVMRDPSYMLKVFDEESSQSYLTQLKNNNMEHWITDVSIVDPKTGRAKILQTSSFPVVKKGKLEYVIGLTFDNTKHFSANKNIKSTFGLVYALVQSMQDAVIAVDTNGLIRFANIKAMNQLNNRLSLDGKAAHQFLESKESEHLKEAVKYNYDQSETFYRSPGKDSDFSEVIISGCGEILSGSAVKALIVFRKDVSSSNIVKNLQLKADVFDSIQDGVLLLDSSTRFISGNKKAFKILRKRDDELHNTILDIFPRHPANFAFNDDILKALSKQAYWTGDIHLPDDEGGFCVIESEVKELVNTKTSTRASYIVTLRDVTERHHQEATIHRQANFDSLTGLPNRVLFLDRLNHEIEVSKRDGTQFSLLFIDLDHFKTVNDTLGHEAGDTLLVEVAERVNDSIRHSDTFSRFGGDEFALLMPKFHRKQGPEIFAKDLIGKLEKLFVIQGQQIYISASIGIAIFPEDGANSSELISNADTAMYEAKRLGRNGFVFHREELNKDAKNRLTIESNLRDAIDSLTIVPYYQQVIDTKTDTIVGCEALARWQHPDLGLVMPQDFISHAENSGLINAITKSLLMIIMVDKAKLDNYKKLSISVNFSAKTLTRTDIKDIFEYFGKAIKNRKPTSQSPTIKDNGFEIDLTGLTIEVTESIFLSSKNSKAAENLIWLRNKGAKIALDDFGTGYSALGYLREFPVDIIKIDKSFIADIAIDKRDLALVKATVEMAKGIGAEIIAEGIESQEQQTILESLGIRFMQGYLFGKPVSFEKFKQLLNKKSTARK